MLAPDLSQKLVVFLEEIFRSRNNFQILPDLNTELENGGAI